MDSTLSLIGSIVIGGLFLIGLMTFYDGVVDHSNEKSNIQHFVDKMLHMNLSNSIFVDCTASHEVVDVYEQLLDNNISITTPNKLANSGPLETYNK